MPAGEIKDELRRRLRESGRYEWVDQWEPFRQPPQIPLEEFVCPKHDFAITMQGGNSKICRICETSEFRQGSDDAEEKDVGDETEASEDLKVVVSIRGGRATIGVQRPSSDPHIESFDDPDLSGLTQEALAVVERARARWEDEPKYPAHERPAPPPRRRPRREQGTAQAEAAEEGAEQPQPETLRLF